MLDNKNAVEAVAVLVATSFSIQLSEISALSRRTAKVAFARQVAMYLAHVSLGLNYSEIGRCFSRDRATVRHACRIVEDRRDDRCFDSMLNRLEQALVGGQVHRAS